MGQCISKLAKPRVHSLACMRTKNNWTELPACGACDAINAQAERYRPGDPASRQRALDAERRSFLGLPGVSHCGRRYRNCQRHEQAEFNRAAHDYGYWRRSSLKRGNGGAAAYEHWLCDNQHRLWPYPSPPVRAWVGELGGQDLLQAHELPQDDFGSPHVQQPQQAEPQLGQVKELDPNNPHAAEEAATAAIIRTCNKCRLPYIKIEGCNHVKCERCGAFQCYVCSKTLGYGYEHLQGWDACELFPGQGPRDRLPRRGGDVGFRFLGAREEL